MIKECTTKQATLISRPTRNILRDYQGDNLLRAFPLQFHYGIGHEKRDGESHCGTGYMKALMYLSERNFHLPQFCCVMHNMFERQQLVSNSYLKHSDGQGESYVGITNEAMDAAVNRFMQGSSGGAAGDLFLRKMQAVTSSMAHTVGASKKARQNMYSYIMRFGMPAIMFTITSEDNVNFRIRIYANTDEGEKPPPSIYSNVNDTMRMSRFTVTVFFP